MALRRMCESGDCTPLSFPHKSKQWLISSAPSSRHFLFIKVIAILTPHCHFTVTKLYCLNSIIPICLCDSVYIRNVLLSSKKSQVCLASGAVLNMHKKKKVTSLYLGFLLRLFWQVYYKMKGELSTYGFRYLHPTKPEWMSCGCNRSSGSLSRLTSSTCIHKWFQR